MVAPTAPCHAATPGLDELYAAALQNNPSLHMRQLEVERSQAEADGLRSRRRTQAQAVVTLSANQFSDAIVGHQTYGGRRASLVARHNLYDPATKLRIAAAESGIAQREQEVANTRTALAAQLVESYLDALAAQDAMDAVAAEAAAASRQVDRLQAMRERQMARVNDLAEAKAYHQTLATRAVDARNERAQALERLHELAGVAVDGVLPLRRQPAPVVGGNLAGWISQAMQSHPQLLALAQAVEAVRRQVEAARADARPQLAANFSHSWSDQGYDNRQQPPYRSTTLGVELRVPLFDGGRSDAGVREAVARQGAAEQALEEARRAIERELRTAWASAEANVARIASTTAEVEAFAQTVVAQERALELGAARVTDVLDARRRLLRARSDQARARCDHLRDLVTLQLRARPVTDADMAGWAGWFEMPR